MKCVRKSIKYMPVLQEIVVAELDGDGSF